MNESFQNRRENDEEPKKMGRRRFLGLFSGALSATALGGTGALSLLKGSVDQDSHQKVEDTELTYDSEDLERLLQEQERIASFDDVSNSRSFIIRIVEESDRYEGELPIVLEFANELTVKDPEGRDRIEYLQQMFSADGVPDAALAEIKKQIIGLAFEESRYDPTRESGEQAKGILQIIPSTWKAFSREGENVLSLVDQTRVAGELLSQTYAHLQNTVKDELDAINAEFFHGDNAAFEKYFLAPVLINSYNAGMGNMASLIHWFARKYGTQEKTVGLLGQEKKLSGYDVFMAMAMKAKEEEAVATYKKYASAYTFKVYGAALCLLRHPSQHVDTLV